MLVSLLNYQPIGNCTLNSDTLTMKNNLFNCMYSLSGIVNNDMNYCMNTFYTMSSYISNNNSYTHPYFYNSIYTISSTLYFKYASQNYCIQNYVPINSDINIQNISNSTAITNPTIINGICHGSGDGASYSSLILVLLHGMESVL